MLNTNSHATRIVRGIEVDTFRNPLKDASTVSAVAGVYKTVFGDAPWYEGYKCPRCKAAYSITHRSRLCESCEPDQVLLVEYWPRNQIIADFYGEMKQPNARCKLARSDEGIVGFAWGYDVHVDDYLAHKLEAPELHKKLTHRKYFYVDEAAVLLPYRGKGIGTQLFRALVENEAHVLYRTLNQSTMHHIGRKLGGQVVMHISENRVIITV